jgi:acetyl esterase/lipase
MADVLRRAAALPDAVVRYADHPDGVVDLHLPEVRARGLVVLVHGGFWRAEWDRRHTRPMAEALRAEGYVVATPEYRRTGAVGEAAGGWPRTFEDLRSAVDGLAGLVARVGVPDLGPPRVIGHSAGGHLALWLASEGLRLDRVVALAPVGDLVDADARGLDDGAVRALLGGSAAEVPDRYSAADPATRLATAGPAHPPLVVLHGTADLVVPVTNSHWARRVPGVELRRLEGVGHFELIDPLDPIWPEVLAALAG